LKSWKIGAIAGLIAGIVLGIVFEISNQMAVSIGLWEPWWRPFAINNIVVNIPLFGFWGIVLGIIYSKTYNIIPKTGILKSLVYGLFLYFIITIRIETFSLAYGLYLDTAGHIFAGFFSWLSYGLVLGLLYEFLSNMYYPTKEKLKIKTYDMKGGIIPGAIAGIADGLASSASIVPGHITGYWGLPIEGQIISTIDFWMSQVGTHIHVNLIWGAVFGAIFAKVYNLVPGKRVLKGLYYGLIMFLITTFLVGSWCILYPIFHNDWAIATIHVGTFWITGFFGFTALGLVLGYLYKPTK